MGTGNIRRAKSYTMVGICIYIINTVMLTLLLIIFKEEWYIIKFILLGLIFIQAMLKLKRLFFKLTQFSSLD